MLCRAPIASLTMARLAYRSAASLPAQQDNAKATSAGTVNSSSQSS
jgi:hypothetical protein